ncbi:MAG: ABC transporter substrate-binding protein [Acidiferrobacterales bacterium]
MKCFIPKTAIALVAGLLVGVSSIGIASAMETPQYGGVLNFVVGSKIPSYDGHRESTFGMIHPIAPFYSLLIRVNPSNPQSPTDFVCDLCKGDVPGPTENGTKYTFKIQRGVKFHDGTKLTAADIVATYQKIIFPPEGIPSQRKTFFRMVESVTATKKYEVVFKLKFPSGAFIPALATPFNFVYAKKDMDEHGLKWHQKNINGSGPFVFVQHQPGAFVEGKRYDGYHHKGQPYLDGYKAISAPKMAVRLQAIRGGRAAIEFRGFPPKARDDLVSALGGKIRVQESDWNCGLMVTPNQKRKPFNDMRVRKALTLGVDRWAGSKYLSRIAIVKTVGGVVYPQHPLAANKEELNAMAGYYPSIDRSQKEAKDLLKQAGRSGMSFEFHNRGVDQPYKVVGTWLIDQWRRIGLKVTQRVQPTPAFYASLRKKRDFDVSMDFNCQSVINPIVDISKFLGSAGNNFGSYEDPVLEDLYNRLEKEGSQQEQRKIIRKYEKRALSEMAHMGVTLWWFKINPHRSFVKGWNIAPSHYLNQQLDNVWLDKKLM